MVSINITEGMRKKNGFVSEDPRDWQLGKHKYDT